MNKLTKFTTIDGLLGLSIVISLLIFTLTLIGGDGSFLIGVGDYFQRLATMNEEGGTSGTLIYAISDSFYNLANFLNGLGSETWSNYFIPMFGQESITGIELFSSKNSMKINALITFAPVFFITLLIIVRVLPKMLFKAILSPFSLFKRSKKQPKKPKKKELPPKKNPELKVVQIQMKKREKKVVHKKPKRKLSLMERFFLFGQRTGLMDLSHKIMSSMRS